MADIDRQSREPKATVNMNDLDEIYRHMFEILGLPKECLSDKETTERTIRARMRTKLDELKGN